MKFVDFHSVVIQNFLSVGEDPISIQFREGLHIITGVNKDKQDRRNGVGKSTIADAVHFAIFGSTIRELKKENIPNHFTGKGTVVELKFSITINDDTTNYVLTRMLDPSKCTLLVNGNDETRDTIANTTEYVCKLLNTSQDIFQNCVIMTVNHTVPFMAKKKVEKRKFIEGIFNLEIFSDMLGNLRTEYNEVKRDLDVEHTKHREVQNNIDQYKEDKQGYVDSKKAKYDKLRKRKTDNDQQLDKLRDKTFDTDGAEIENISDSITSIEKNLETCSDKINKFNIQISSLDTTINHKKDTLSGIGTTEDKCPVCLKPVSDHDKEHIEQERASLKETICNLRKDKADTTDMLDKVTTLSIQLKEGINRQRELLADHNLKISESKNNKQKIKQLEDWNTQIDNDVDSLNNENNQYDDAITKQQDRLQSVQDKINSIQHKLSVLDVVKFVVSEEGVKSYIVKKILQVFNSKLAYYLCKMDSNCLCIFNEYFEEEIVDEKGKSCSYYNFSGAERKNIDLACLFAFMDIRRLQGSVSYNFSIYDELLDSSLDESGVDLVLELLRERVTKYNECVMIISHRKESVKIGTHYNNPGEVIFLAKENGITRRVEFKEDEE